VKSFGVFLNGRRIERDLMITLEALAEAKKRKTTPGPSPAGKKTNRGGSRKKG
jgi:hypothetical protein